MEIDGNPENYEFENIHNFTAAQLNQSIQEPQIQKYSPPDWDDDEKMTPPETEKKENEALSTDE